MRTTGTVKLFNASKGFGFISPSGGGLDVFVHVTALQGNGYNRALEVGQRVEFDVTPGKIKGKWQAQNVTVLSY